MSKQIPLPTLVELLAQEPPTTLEEIRRVITTATDVMIADMEKLVNEYSDVVVRAMEVADEDDQQMIAVFVGLEAKRYERAVEGF